METRASSSPRASTILCVAHSQRDLDAPGEQFEVAAEAVRAGDGVAKLTIFEARGDGAISTAVSGKLT